MKPKSGTCDKDIQTIIQTSEAFAITIPSPLCASGQPASRGITKPGVDLDIVLVHDAEPQSPLGRRVINPPGFEDSTQHMGGASVDWKLQTIKPATEE